MMDRDDHHKALHLTTLVSYDRYKIWNLTMNVYDETSQDP